MGINNCAITISGNQLLNCFQDENVGLLSEDLNFNELIFQMENERELEDEQHEAATIILGAFFLIFCVYYIKISCDKFCRKSNESPENKEAVNAISSV
eukprot:snap_masked-scaffold_25-processed-gene-4.36-mRNA-1 protein AED:1.00 eAED:1.00 QI:0/0/0/0/1/1/2/0/97